MGFLECPKVGHVLKEQYSRGSWRPVPWTPNLRNADVYQKAPPNLRLGNPGSPAITTNQPGRCWLNYKMRSARSALTEATSPNGRAGDQVSECPELVRGHGEQRLGLCAPQPEGLLVPSLPSFWVLKRSLTFHAFMKNLLIFVFGF